MHAHVHPWLLTRRNRRGVNYDSANGWGCLCWFCLDNVRFWLVINEDGNMVTARQEPRLVLVFLTCDNDTLTISAAYTKDLLLPITPPATNPLLQCRWVERASGLWEQICMQSLFTSAFNCLNSQLAYKTIDGIHDGNFTHTNCTSLILAPYSLVLYPSIGSLFSSNNCLNISYHICIYRVGDAAQW